MAPFFWCVRASAPGRESLPKGVFVCVYSGRVARAGVLVLYRVRDVQPPPQTGSPAAGVPEHGEHVGDVICSGQKCLATCAWRSGWISNALEIDTKTGRDDTKGLAKRICTFIGSISHKFESSAAISDAG